MLMFSVIHYMLYIYPQICNKIESASIMNTFYVYFGLFFMIGAGFFFDIPVPDFKKMWRTSKKFRHIVIYINIYLLLYIFLYIQKYI